MLSVAKYVNSDNYEINGKKRFKFKNIILNIFKINRN